MLAGSSTGPSELHGVDIASQRVSTRQSNCPVDRELTLAADLQKVQLHSNRLENRTNLCLAPTGILDDSSQLPYYALSDYPYKHPILV